MTKNQKPKEEESHSFFKTLIVAIICATIVRSFFFEPFHIPSSSMKPGLLIGDYIFVSKYSYGYSRYSFPFGINFFAGRTSEDRPNRGDVVVFRLPSNPSINYVKRVIGLPGDTVQMKAGLLYINGKEISKTYEGIFKDGNVEIEEFLETLPEGKTVKVLDEKTTDPDDTGIYTVPTQHYFMMGDNRDNSQDSRYESLVGFVHEDLLIGKARRIFFSTQHQLWQVWKLHDAIRFNRIFKKID